MSLQDITTRQAERRVQLGFEQAALGLGLADGAGRFTEVNPALCALLGRTKDALLGHTLADYAGAGPTSRYHASQLTSAAHDRRSAELQVLRPDGSEVWLGVVTTLVREVSGENYWFEQLRDVTDRKQAERALQELAMFDPLTGLPNQNLLKDRVAQALNRAGQEGSGVAVVLIGIDRFRVVTDSLGHSAGEAAVGPVRKGLAGGCPGPDGRPRRW